MKAAYDLAQSQAVSENDPGALEETVGRIRNVGPTSLMNAIMNNVAVAAVKDINEAGRFTNIGSILSENAEEIREMLVSPRRRNLGLSHLPRE